MNARRLGVSTICAMFSRVTSKTSGSSLASRNASTSSRKASCSGENSKSMRRSYRSDGPSETIGGPRPGDKQPPKDSAGTIPAPRGCARSMGRRGGRDASCRVGGRCRRVAGGMQRRVGDEHDNGQGAAARAGCAHERGNGTERLERIDGLDSNDGHHRAPLRRSRRIRATCTRIRNTGCAGQVPPRTSATTISPRPPSPPTEPLRRSPSRRRPIPGSSSSTCTRRSRPIRV